MSKNRRMFAILAFVALFSWCGAAGHLMASQTAAISSVSIELVECDTGLPVANTQLTLELSAVGGDVIQSFSGMTDDKGVFSAPLSDQAVGRILQRSRIVKYADGDVQFFDISALVRAEGFRAMPLSRFKRMNESSSTIIPSGAQYATEYTCLLQRTGDPTQQGRNLDQEGFGWASAARASIERARNSLGRAGYYIGEESYGGAKEAFDIAGDAMVDAAELWEEAAEAYGEAVEAFEDAGQTEAANNSRISVELHRKDVGDALLQATEFYGKAGWCAQAGGDYEFMAEVMKKKAEALEQYAEFFED